MTPIQKSYLLADLIQARANIEAAMEFIRAGNYGAAHYALSKGNALLKDRFACVTDVIKSGDQQ